MLIGILTGCGLPQYTLKQPVPSLIQYGGAHKPNVILQLIDEREDIKIKNKIAEVQKAKKEGQTAEIPNVTYFSVFELGGSNNPNAMSMLKEMSNDNDVLLRSYALSAIGTLGAEKEIEFLKAKYEEYTDIDRFMALKAIGDIGTPAAVAFLRTAGSDPKNENEPGIGYCVKLYLY